MKKIAVVIAVILMVSGCGLRNLLEREQEAQAEEGSSPSIVVNDAGAIGQEMLELDTIAINRSMVAKMIALTMLTPEEIKDQPYTAEFSDVAEDEWYAKYINAAVRLNILSGGQDGFRPNQPLSISEAQIIIDRINVNNKTTIRMTEDTKDLPISYALWVQLYIKTIAAVAEVDSDSLENKEKVENALREKLGIQKKNLTILATPGNTEALPAWRMATAQGLYSFEGMNMDGYIDKEVGLYTKGGEVMMVSGVTNETPVIENAYIMEGAGNLAKVTAGGVHRNYGLMAGMTVTEGIGDITLDGETITAIKPVEEKKSGQIKRLTDEYIELPEGKIERTKDMQLFLAENGVVSGKRISDLIPGAEAVLYLKEGKAVAAVMEQAPTPEKMRVLISTDNYNALIHPAVTIRSEGGFDVKTQGETKEFLPGEELVFSASSNKELFDSQRIYITPKQPEGKIEITSIKRTGEHPEYRGTIEIAKEGEGFILVNEVELEQYLYGVIASQIPEALGAEATKAQSIVTRSNAYNQFYLNRLQEYGAQVDDSIRYQLYAAFHETETARAAVDATKGIVLEYEGEVIKPTYFLASGGYTANSGETWANAKTGKFPDETEGYLSAQKQATGTIDGDLSEEAAAKEFFKNPAENAYEAAVSWVRWQVTMTKEDIEASINNNILHRSSQYPAQVKTLAADGSYEEKPASTIGELKDLAVTQRGEGGNIMQMKIEGTAGSFLLETEGTIRSVIKPYQHMAGKEGILLTRADGTKVENYSSMPSAFYTFDITKEEDGTIKSITFYGGGNGHGVGMSQCGAQALAEQGIAVEDILQHYYQGTTLTTITKKLKG